MIFDTLKINEPLLNDFLTIRREMDLLELKQMYARINANARVASSVTFSRAAEIQCSLIGKKIKERAISRINGNSIW